MEFSIIIPTWNNLAMLKLCVRALRTHSKHNHQIILHINEGKDGTRAWAKLENLDFTDSDENIGICWAVNKAAELVENSHILYLNDDMYVLPDWDSCLINTYYSLPNKDLFMISATMIEPYLKNHACQITGNYGRTVETFEEKKLLDEYKSFEKKDWNGSSWPPLLLPTQLWRSVGGFSTEFSPGMYSDPDFSMKLWEQGCRTFFGVGKSRVYHFQARSTGRVKKNDGRKQFMQKWGISAHSFYSLYLKMGTPATPSLKAPTKFSFPVFQARLLTRAKLLLKGNQGLF